MLPRVIRIGLLTGLATVIACAEAPKPPPATGGPGANAAKTNDSTVAAGSAGGQGEDSGAESARVAGGAPKGAQGARGAAGEGDGFGGELPIGALPDDRSGPPMPPRVIAPVELGTWDGGNEVDTGEGAKSPVPVTAADPSWGSPKALVTIVAFSDLQCPFCARSSRTLAELRKLYGKDQLRIVWKNNPLPFHQHAQPASEAAMTVYKKKGAAWFWAYHDALFAGMIDQKVIDGSLPRGMTPKDVQMELVSGDIQKKITEDLELGKKIGVTGTPAFFINGVYLSGAQPIENFKAIIDEQLAAGKKAVAGGTAAAKVYAQLSTANFKKPADRPDSLAQRPPEDTTTVHKVPIDGAPVRGKNTALVTIVMFSDFQCPFCMKVTPTIEQLQKDYGDKVRIVFKQNPLPFHTRAEPAAELALEARAQKGDTAFWAAHDKLFAANGKLDDADLEAIAKDLGLDAKKVMAAIAQKKYAAAIVKDQELADDVSAGGTPTFFINGRRLVGAQPIDKFKAIIDEEIPKSEALIKKGTAAAKLYDTIIKDGKTAPPPVKLTVAAPTKDNPTRGPANAKIVVQIFSDFECPFCKRVEPTLAELDAAYPNKLRFVWRNTPLPFHKNAMPAALAAMEAFKQKGPEGFWKIHDAFFADQSKLDRQGIEQTAAALGLDVAKIDAAMDGKTHEPLIEADKKAADDAKINGTPAVLINGYLVSGAQPLAKFKKIVNLALKEAK